jgi:hypothetical protein
MVDLIGVFLKRGNARDMEGLINAAETRVIADPTPMTSSQLYSRNLSAKVNDVGGVVADAILPLDDERFRPDRFQTPSPHGGRQLSWFLRHVCHEGYLKAIERGDRRSGARDGDRQGLPRFTSPRWRIATSCYNSL